MLGAAPASAHHHDHGPDDLGVLIADHGEPPEYNELTYWSFRAFVSHLMEMGIIPAWLRSIDTGTVTQDPKCYGCPEPNMSGARMDAWLRPHERPGAFVPATDSTEPHYVQPGGDGLGEPDIFEHAGLMTWHEWRLMGGRSPNYDQKLAAKRAVIKALHRRHGRSLPVRVGYGIDPRIGGGHQGMNEAVEALIRRDRVKRIVVAYHGVGFSDVMQTHMVRHEVEKAVQALDPEVKLHFAAPMGATRDYVRAIARKARAELRRLPRGAKPAIHLSGHGLPTAECGEYDCGADAYHPFARGLFARTSAEIRTATHGRAPVFHVYGDGGSGESDPEDKVDSPIEALDEREKQGFTHVIDIPYEFAADSRDTLIVLRQGYEQPIPAWDRRYESRFTRNGLHVKITNSSFEPKLKAKAFEVAIERGIRRLLKNGGAVPAPPPDHRGHSG